MATVYYVKAKDQEMFLQANGIKYTGMSKAPTMFLSRAAAFQAYEDYRSMSKMAGKPATLMEIKEVSL